MVSHRCVGGLVAASAIAACGDNRIVDNYPEYRAVVYGTVVSATGAPTAGARVQLAAVGDSAALERTGAALTGEAGTFRVSVASARAGALPVVVRVASSTGDVVFLRSVPVAFRAETGALDSVTVHATVR